MFSFTSRSKNGQKRDSSRAAQRRRRTASAPVLESLESRLLLTASPFDLAAFTPLVGQPTVVAGPGGVGGAPLMDLNHDGIGDLVVQFLNGTDLGTSTKATVAALWVNADGSSTVYNIASYPVNGAALPVIDQAAVADFNGDGQPDVAVVYNDGGLAASHQHLGIYLGEPDGRFIHPNADIDLGATSTTLHMSTFDMSGDGNADVVLHDNGKFTVFRGLADGSMAAPKVTTFATAKVTNVIFNQDLNGDGIKDVAISSLGGIDPVNFTFISFLQVFTGKSDGSFNATDTFHDFTNNLTLLDLRQLSTDNKLDIVAYSAPAFSLGGAATVSVLRNNGSAGFAITFTTATFTDGFASQFAGDTPATQPLITTDLNNDGANDLVLVEGSGLSTNVTVHIEKNTGNGAFTETQKMVVPSIAAGSMAVSVGDVDGDGLTDVFVPRQTIASGIQATVFFNHGAAAFGSPGVEADPSISSSQAPSLADITGDGKLDVIYFGFSATLGSNTTEVFSGTANEAFAPSVLTTGFLINLNPFQHAPDPLLDFTGDGAADLIAYNNNGPSLGDALGLSIVSADNTGALAALTPAVTTGSDIDEAPHVGDFNNDGKPDLFYASTANGTHGLYILINSQTSPTDTAGGDAATARDLGTLTGPVALTEFVNSPIGADQRDRFDFYKFTLTQTSTIRITAKGGSGSVFTSLRNSSQGTIVNSFLDPAVMNATLDPGTYFIDVEKGAGADTNYRLVINFPAAGPQISVHHDDATITSGQAAAIEFGDVIRTTTDTHLTFRVRNDGLSTLNLGSITFPTGFALADNALATTLAPGDSDTVSFKMLTDTVGTFAGDIVIPSDDAGTPNFHLPVHGKVEEIPAPAVTTAVMAVKAGLITITSGQALAINYGVATLNQDPAPQIIFVITNTGTQALSVGTPTIPAGYTLVKAPATVIAPSTADTLIVKLKDNALGVFPGNITFTNNSDGVNNIFSIPVTGSVITAPIFPPDLTGEIQDVLVNNVSVTAGAQAVPGDSVTLNLRVFNSGAGNFAGGTINVAVSASADQSLSAGDKLIQTLPVKLPAIIGGGHADVVLKVTLPKDMPAGDVFFLGNLDSSGVVAESNENNNTAVAGHVLPVILQAGQLGTRNVKLILQQANGNLVTFAVTKGSALVTVDPNTGAMDLNITGTGASITITSKNTTLGGSNEILFNKVTVNGVVQNLAASLAAAAAAVPPLSSFIAKTAVLTGTFDAPAGLKALTLFAADGATINIGAAADPKGTLAVTIGTVKNTSLNSAMPLKSITAVNWLDDDATADTITAPSLGSLKIAGDKKSLTAGDFQAGLTLAGAAGVPTTLGTVTVAGSLGSGDAQNPDVWNITGAVKSITGGATSGLSITNLTALATLKLGRVASASISGTADIGAVSAIEWLAGTIAAGSVKSVKIAGDVKNAVRGDFDAALSLTGTANAAIKQTLGAVTAAGLISGATWSVHGPVGAIAAARLIDSVIHVGIDAGVTGLPATAADLDDTDLLASIKSLTLKGIKSSTDPDFVNSIVASRTISAASLGRIDTQNAGVPLGLAAHTLGAVTSIDPVTGKKIVRGPLPDEDFLIRVI